MSTSTIPRTATIEKKKTLHPIKQAKIERSMTRLVHRDLSPDLALGMEHNPNESGVAPSRHSSTISKDRIIRRQRALRACDKCRASKTKCEGQKPVCARCEGYGYQCTWSHKSLSKGSHDTSILEKKFRDRQALCQAINSYETLIKSLQAGLNDSESSAVDSTIASIRQQLPEYYRHPFERPESLPKTPVRLSSITSQDEPSEDTLADQSYLGKASDIHFFNTVKGILDEQDSSDGTVLEKGILSYNQASLYGKIPDAPNRSLVLPSKENADNFVEIYFSTIHLAYPFVCKSDFLAAYKKFWDDGPHNTKNGSWLPLLYTIFAIGAFYTSFPHKGNDDPNIHARYFEQALLYGRVTGECSCQNFHFDQSHCQADDIRCWNILGLAIRMAQSIGLHVEDPGLKFTNRANGERREMGRRAWYSLYVLDRLLALQLGRPVAIHEKEYFVHLPTDNTPAENMSDQISSSSDSRPAVLMYFIQVIQFSRIIGRVVTEFYRPTQTEVSPDDLLSFTSLLDNELLSWKANLPRYLRFDLGHTFEQGDGFRRQRNMLAIKFHHLRGLIHRPYLCLSWLQRDNAPFLDFYRRRRTEVEKAEAICVLEAQETAHLLHNVFDERSLIHNFPWWQMISCLICASSILLVASACVQKDQIAGELKSQTLDEDAETCLKVFDALSTNSSGARQAMKMMTALKKLKTLSGISNIDDLLLDLSDPQLDRNSRGAPGKHGINPMPRSVYSGVYPGPAESITNLQNSSANTMNWPWWCSEISDSMVWSSQFLLNQPLGNSQLVQQYPATDTISEN
ncbi:MAG: hypothetical protein M1834_000523 [Cirrosporium novae-zelandiae]|nr:MAG: hypothetical protein M1834_000523 [Cirrosporium novae-zelandiae]